MPEKNKLELIRAAGGIVWRDGLERQEILLVYRARYDDWSLPKGKLKKGERWQEAALREVLEETGLQTELDQLAGEVFYYVSGRPKLVLFWNMIPLGSAMEIQQIIENSDEIDQVAWVTFPECLDRMSYAGERALVEQEFRRK